MTDCMERLTRIGIYTCDACRYTNVYWDPYSKVTKCHACGDVREPSRNCGKQIRDAREDKGMNLRELAAAAGLRTVQLSEIERSIAEPDELTLGRLAEVLGTTVEALKMPWTPRAPTPDEMEDDAPIHITLEEVESARVAGVDVDALRFLEDSGVLALQGDQWYLVQREALADGSREPAEARPLDEAVAAACGRVLSFQFCDEVELRERWFGPQFCKSRGFIGEGDPAAGTRCVGAGLLAGLTARELEVLAARYPGSSVAVEAEKAGRADGASET